MFTRRRNSCKNVLGFKVLFGKKVKGFKKRDTVHKCPLENTEKLDYLEISNFLKRSAEAAVRKCTSLSSRRNTRDGVLF